MSGPAVPEVNGAGDGVGAEGCGGCCCCGGSDGGSAVFLPPPLPSPPLVLRSADIIIAGSLRRIFSVAPLSSRRSAAAKRLTTDAIAFNQAVIDFNLKGCHDANRILVIRFYIGALKNGGRRHLPPKGSRGLANNSCAVIVHPYVVFSSLANHTSRASRAAACMCL